MAGEGTYLGTSPDNIESDAAPQTPAMCVPWWVTCCALPLAVLALLLIDFLRPQGARPADSKMAETDLCATGESPHTSKPAPAPTILAEVIFIRHGMSCANAVARHPSDAIVKLLADIGKEFGGSGADAVECAYRDPPLTNLGMQNSMDAAPHFAALRPGLDFVGSSAVLRAMQTARLMFPKRTVHVLPNIGEVDDGNAQSPMYAFCAEQTPQSRAAKTKYWKSTPGDFNQSLDWSYCSYKEKYDEDMKADRTARHFFRGVMEVQHVLNESAEAAEWKKIEDGGDIDDCGNTWPVHVNMDNFRTRILPAIIGSIFPNGQGENTPKVARLAIVTHSFTMKRTLQPLVFLNHMPRNNAAVVMRYAIQQDGMVTELMCTDEKDCRKRLIYHGFEKSPTRRHCQDVAACHQVIACT